MINPIRSLHFLRHILFFTLAAAGVSMATELGDVEHQTITVQSQGVRLAGDIYKPKGLKVDEKRPGILLVPGWGGSKE
ncbi:MAG: hypothetical protein V7746_18940, partial [Halioglobus sp.]